MATSMDTNSCPSYHEIYNFERLYLGHYYYIFSLSHLCSGVQKKIFNEMMHFHYKTIIFQCPCRKKPCPRGHEIYLTIHHYYIFSLLRNREADFSKKYINFIFLPKLLPPLDGEKGEGQVMKFSSPYHTDVTYQIW